VVGHDCESPNDAGAGRVEIQEKVGDTKIQSLLPASLVCIRREWQRTV
jgi:hypothetical protein